jgi:glutamate dehydrogenase
MRMQEDTGAAPGEIARAYTIAREVLEARSLWGAIEALDGKVHGGAQIDALLGIWYLLRHATRWLLNVPSGRRDIAASVARYAAGVSELRAALARVHSGEDRAAAARDLERWARAGFPAPLAESLSQLQGLLSVFDIVEVAAEHAQPIDRVAQVYYALGEALHLKWLMSRIEELPVDGRWHAQARGTLRDELFGHQRALAAQVLARAKPSEDGAAAVARWLGREDGPLRFTLGMLADMRNQVAMDYPTVSVAIRRLAQLVQAGTRAA